MRDLHPRENAIERARTQVLADLAYGNRLLAEGDLSKTFYQKVME